MWQFLLWKGLMVLKGLILDSSELRKVWCSWKDWFLTISTFGGCGCHERTDFNYFYFGRIWSSLKNIFWTIFAFYILNKCSWAVASSLSVIALLSFVYSTICHMILANLPHWCTLNIWVCGIFDILVIGTYKAAVW